MAVGAWKGCDGGDDGVGRDVRGSGAGVESGVADCDVKR